jgi:Capsular polysaccharide synthesis protein
MLMIIGFVFFSALLMGIILLVAFKYYAIARANLPEVPHKITTGSSNSSNTAKIPKIIWTYWHELPQPNLVTLCQQNWQRYAPDHEVRVLHKNTILEWIPSHNIPHFFSELPAYRQADWIRLQLLSLYGGIWIDASIILTQDLNWVHDIQQQEKSEYVGFYINLYTRFHQQPIVENWFMAAVVGSGFIRELTLEFNRALTLGEQAYLTEIRQSGRSEQVIQLLTSKMQTYLIMHVAASKVLDQNTEPYRLTLYRAEDTALGFHHLLEWRKSKLHVRFALTPCPKRLSFLVKLRGGERTRIDEYLSKGWYYRGSLLAKYLNI